MDKYIDSEWSVTLIFHIGNALNFTPVIWQIPLCSHALYGLMQAINKHLSIQKVISDLGYITAPHFSRLLRHAWGYGGHILDLTPGPHGGKYTKRYVWNCNYPSILPYMYITRVIHHFV